MFKYIIVTLTEHVLIKVVDEKAHASVHNLFSRGIAAVMRLASLETSPFPALLTALTVASVIRVIGLRSVSMKEVFKYALSSIGSLASIL